jgi:DNA-directed RNA polymerase subunit alpha
MVWTGCDRRTRITGHQEHPHGREPMPRIPFRNLTQANELEEKLEMSTAEIGLSVRTTNCLEERGIFTVHDLLKCTRSDLLSISNFGEKTLEEVYKALEKIGFFRTGAPDGDREPLANVG